ncbi:MAG: hypothetical protein IJ794_18030 [Lachnospiraceae bacterium]|nr:hypothetical protein [Lachnospiraceae bacterium]
MRSIINHLLHMLKKIRFRIKLMRLDSKWHYYGGSSYELFPPSFYYTHSREEIQRITEEELAALRQMIKEYQTRNGQK